MLAPARTARRCAGACRRQLLLWRRARKAPRPCDAPQAERQTKVDWLTRVRQAGAATASAACAARAACAAPCPAWPRCARPAARRWAAARGRAPCTRWPGPRSPGWRSAGTAGRPSGSRPRTRPACARPQAKHRAWGRAPVVRKQPRHARITRCCARAPAAATLQSWSGGGDLDKHARPQLPWAWVPGRMHCDGGACEHAVQGLGTG
jgi:hypothetical protein